MLRFSVGVQAEKNAAGRPGIQRLRALAMAFSCLLACGIFCATASAQQTIFNVPSADVTPPKAVYLETEGQFRTWKPDRFFSGTEYVAVGVGHNTELNLTLSNLNAPATGTLSMGLGFKTSWPLLKNKLPRRELKVTLGELMPISLRGQGVGSWTYGHLSGRIPKLNTRVSAGAFAGTKQLFGRNTVGFIGGFEHPVTERFSLIADWFSGTSNYGLFIPGFSYVLPKGINMFAGFQIPNNARCGRSGFVLEFSKVLP